MIIKLNFISLNFMAMIFRDVDGIPRWEIWVVGKDGFRCGEGLIYHQICSVLVIFKSYFMMICM